MNVVFAAEITTRFAFPAARAEETGLNRSVELMVLLTFHHATLAAGTRSQIPSVSCILQTNYCEKLKS